jgi:C4-dicarboxylate transporter, DctQ subunit
MLNKLLSRLEEVIVAVTLTIAVIFTFIEVILRKFFGSSLGFTHEAVVYLLIFSGLIGASIGVREKVHLGVDLVVQQFPYKVQKTLVLLTNLTSILFCFIIAGLGVQQVQNIAAFGQVTPELEIPLFVPLLIVPIAFSLMAIRFIQQLITIIKTPAEEVLQQEGGAH